jgi:ABC-2 type transport system ATP-binding protein
VVLNQGEIIADDDVENLLDLFRTQAYEVTVAGDVPDSLRRDLESSYDAANWTELGDRWRFEVALSGGERLHALTGDLLDADVRLVGVDAVEPDLEEVFLRLTGENAETAPSRRSDQPPETPTRGIEPTIESGDQL